MASKDVEIRRLAVLKTTTASISSFSILNLSLEILKSHTEPITVELLYQTAEKILQGLPMFKKRVDLIALNSAIEAEKWVVKEEEDEKKEEMENVIKSYEQVFEETPEIPAPAPVEKEDENIVKGEIQVISKNKKGIKIGDEWYNSRTEVALKKGDIVRIWYNKGQKGGRFIEKIEKI